jgi:hypothetical protein
MLINVTHNIGELRSFLAKAKVESRAAYAAALSDTAFYARRKLQDHMSERFDRVTPFVRSSVRVNMATAATLEATIGPAKQGNGLDPQNVVRAQAFGGERKLKRSERAFAALGLLRPGYYATLPAQPIEDKLDEYGNYKGAFYRQLIAYFGAVGAAADKRRAKQAKRGRNESGQATIGGVAYFLGTGAPGAMPYGIWQKSGVHGKTLRPVLLFVRKPSYTQRLDFDAVGTDAVQAKFASNLQTRMAQAGL